MRVGRVEVHHHWARTFALDIVLLVVVSWWYMTATYDAPFTPDPDHSFSAPVVIREAQAPCHRCYGSQVHYRRGYVGPTTYAILVAMAVNWVLLLGAAVIGFFRLLWGPPPAYDE